MKIILDWLSKILCFILCIILFIAIFVFLGLAIVKQVTNTDRIIEIVADVDTEKIFGEEIINSLYNDVKQYDVNTEIIDGIINDSEFKKLVGKILGNTIEIILYAKEEPIITTGEVIKVLDKQIDSIAQSRGIVLTLEQRNLILQEVEKEINNIINTISIEEIEANEETKEGIETIRFIFGGSLSVILVIVIALLILIIALARWSIYRFAIWTGVTTVLAGGVFTLLGFSIEELISIYYINEIPEVIMTILNNHIINIMTTTGIITAIIGTIQIVYYQILKQKKENPILNISY